MHYYCTIFYQQDGHRSVRSIFQKDALHLPLFYVQDHSEGSFEVQGNRDYVISFSSSLLPFLYIELLVIDTYLDLYRFSSNGYVLVEGDV